MRTHNTLTMWLEHVTGGEAGYYDVFSRSYSGYWATSFDHHPERGFLAFEHEGEGVRPTDLDLARARDAWAKGRKLPPGFHRFDDDAARAAWVAGVRRWGEDWFSTGDGPRYDWALQMGLGVTSEIHGKTEARYG